MARIDDLLEIDAAPLPRAEELNDIAIAAEKAADSLIPVGIALGDMTITIDNINWDSNTYWPTFLVASGSMFMSNTIQSAIGEFAGASE